MILYWCGPWEPKVRQRKMAKNRLATEMEVDDFEKWQMAKKSLDHLMECLVSTELEQYFVPAIAE